MAADKKMNPDFYKTINEFLEKRDKKEIVILDIGCVEVRPYSEFLINVSTKYIGLDNNSGLIEKAKAKVDNSKCELLLKNVEELTMPKETFDIIVCNNMLAYTDQVVVLNKVFDLLKKDGLCISFNNNTIYYFFYKIVNPYKAWYTELPYSIVVILNTWLFRLTGLRPFRTKYNTISSLRKILDKNNYRTFSISQAKTDSPYEVIDFYYVK
jgi:ubiquinone/menaquinone biosynthesis C-methylase UbiE